MARPLGPAPGGGGAAASSTSSTTTWWARIRLVSVERGLRPARRSRWCPSAAPVRCTAPTLAALLGMRTVVVPRHPGVLSTFGLLGTEVRNDYARTSLQKPPDYDRGGGRRRLRRAGAPGQRLAGRRGRARRRAPRPRGSPTCATATRASRSRCRGRERDLAVDAPDRALPRAPPPALHVRAGRRAGRDRHRCACAAAGRVAALHRCPRLAARRGARRAARAGAGAASTSPGARLDRVSVRRPRRAGRGRRA